MQTVTETLASAILTPEPEDWTRLYTPEQAEVYRPELEQLEAELDDQHPGWRARQPFHREPPDRKAWIKRRLRRRKLIVEGRGDWGVVVVWKGEGAKRRPFAVAVKPTTVPGVSLDAYRAVVSAPALARALGAPLQAVQEALDEVPVGVRDVRGYVAARVGKGVA
ncbi:MAG: hypothetical protein GY925_26395 [Actinomycetia bacterium]|nr:hypothetical protein [Actinomycetes bacterium]